MKVLTRVETTNCPSGNLVNNVLTSLIPNHEENENDVLRSCLFDIFLRIKTTKDSFLRHVNFDPVLCIRVDAQEGFPFVQKARFPLKPEALTHLSCAQSTRISHVG